MNVCRHLPTAMLTTSKHSHYPSFSVYLSWLTGNETHTDCVLSYQLTPYNIKNPFTINLSANWDYHIKYTGYMIPYCHVHDLRNTCSTIVYIIAHDKRFH